MTMNVQNIVSTHPHSPHEDISEVISNGTAALVITSPRKCDADYIPEHLRDYVFHQQEDFYISRCFDPSLLAHLMYNGFLPIATKYGNQHLLLPKLHLQRCLVLLERPLHVPKSVRKRSKKYKLVLNHDIQQVVKGCHEQHGEPWLFPPMVEAFQNMFDLQQEGISISETEIVRIYTVEIWDIATNTIVAGELGYTVGKVYTSLTGFSRVSGAGTVQLHALSRLLYLSGMKVWDLGMSMDYKMSLGAEDFPRDVFLAHLYRWRTCDQLLQLKENVQDIYLKQGYHAKTLFDIIRPINSEEENIEIAESAIHR